MSTPSFTALVPMKGHSERVPGKNVRRLAGRPLCEWVLTALRDSDYVKETIVNTDSEQIAEVARACGARVLERPDHLLGDMVTIEPLIEWDLKHAEGDLFLQTHSTNPLLSTATIDEAIKRFVAQEDHDSLFTVTAHRTRLYWPDGRPVNHDPANLIRTQDLPPVFEENSCVYLFTRQVFYERRHRLGANPMMMPIDPLEAIDIDEEHEFVIAEGIMNARLATR